MFYKHEVLPGQVSYKFDVFQTKFFPSVCFCLKGVATFRQSSCYKASHSEAHIFLHQHIFSFIWSLPTWPSWPFSSRSSSSSRSAASSSAGSWAFWWSSSASQWFPGFPNSENDLSRFVCARTRSAISSCWKSPCPLYASLQSASQMNREIKPEAEKVNGTFEPL